MSKNLNLKLDLSSTSEIVYAKPKGPDDKCQVCAKEWNNADPKDKRNCSDCGIFACKNYVLKTLGETVPRPICSGCLEHVKKDVAIQKSPRGVIPRGDDDKCQLCASSWNPNDPMDKRTCTDCGLYVCGSCAPEYVVKTLGEQVSRHICAKCIILVKKEVTSKKSPRGLGALKFKKPSCPQCKKAFDKKLRSPCHCFECREKKCVTCAPRYRLVSLGEDFDRRICKKCVNIVKQRISAAAPPSVGAFGMRVRTGTALRENSVEKKVIQVAAEPQKEEEETAPEPPATKPQLKIRQSVLDDGLKEIEEKPAQEPIQGQGDDDVDEDEEEEEKEEEVAVVEVVAEVATENTEDITVEKEEPKPARQPESAGEVKVRGDTVAVKHVVTETAPESEKDDETPVFVMKRPAFSVINRRATVLPGSVPKLEIIAGEAETQLL